MSKAKAKKSNGVRKVAAVVRPASQVSAERNIELEKQNEELLREQAVAQAAAEEYAELFDFAPVASFILDAHGFIRKLNHAAAAMMGLDRSKVVGEGFIRFVAAETQPVFVRFWRDMVRFDIRHECEVRFGRSECAPHDVLVKGVAIAGRDGKRGYCRLAVTDITEIKKRTDAALRESEGRYRTVADCTYDWEFWNDADGKPIYVSPSCERITGRRSAEFLADPKLTRKLIHPDDLAAFDRHICEIKEKQIAGQAEWRIRHADGTWRWVDHVCQPVFDDNGKYLGTRGSNRDITDRKQAEAALRESEERYRTLFDQAADAIAVFDPQTLAILEFNDVACRRLGYTRAEFAKLRIPDIDVIESATETRRHSRRVIDEDIEIFETKHRTRRGEVLDIEVRARAIRVGERSLIQGVWRDITGRKQAEQELLRTRNFLQETERIGKVGGWEFNIDTGRQTWTDEVYRIHEVDLDYQPTLQKGIAFYAPESRPVMEHAVQRAIQFGEPFDVTLAFITAKGNRRCVQAIGKADLAHRRVYGFFQDITDRKRAEEAVEKLNRELEQRVKERTAALAEAESRYRNLAENTKDIIHSVDARGVVTFVGPQTLQYGWKPDEIVGRQIIEFIVPEDRDRIAGELERSVNTGEVRDVEFRVRTPDGRERWFEETGSPRHDSAGRITGFIGVLRDITGRKQAEAALHESEERYRMLADFTDDFVELSDTKGNVLYLSPSCERHLGLTVQAVQSDSHSVVIHPDDRQAIRQAHAANLAGKSTETEYRIRDKAGAWLWLEGHCTPICGAEGRVEKLLLVSRNITERNRADETLRQSEEQFRAMFETASIGMAQADPKTGQFLRVNRKMCAITGYPMDELLSLHIPDITHPDDRQHDWELFQRVVRGKQSDYHVEKRYIRKDGTPVWVNVNMSVIRDAQGGLLRTMATIEDISERKKTEERITQLSRVQAVLSGVSHAIAHIPARQNLLNEICRVAVEKGGLKLAWVGMVSSDGCVRPVASAGQIDYIDNIRVTVAGNDPHGRGPVGTAIRENRDIVIDDVEKDPRMTPWKERALRFGMRYVASFPIRIDSRVVGAFSAYAPTAGFFDETEIALLKQISDDLSFALTAIERDEDRRKAEQQLRLNDAALGAAANGIAIVNRDGNIEWVNAAFTSLTGYSFEEVLGKNPRVLKSGVQDAPFYEALWKTILSGKVWRGELVNRRKDGTVYHEEMTVTPVRTGGDQISHFIAIKQNVSERKNMEREMIIAIEQEQERIGRDLHDGLCQMLTGAKFRAALLGQKLRDMPLIEGGDCDIIEALLDESIDQARGLAYGLNPIKPDPGSLAESLRHLAARMDTETGPRCVCKIPRPVPIAEQSVAIHLYRIAQEAMQNALKHSGAKTVTLSLTRRADIIKLSVVDDGNGIDENGTRNGGQGLFNMRARASHIGGKLEIRSSKEKGTAIACRLQRPVKPREQQT